VELRWDPTLNEWVIVSGQRERRPLLPESFCPFCPGSAEVPSTGWDVLSLGNKYPSLMPSPPPPDVRGDPLYRCKPSLGFCEVILYTPEHSASLSGLSVKHIEKLVDLWAERYRKLGEERFVKYVLIFENKGREIGVTLDHPHGQIYAFPFVPPKIKKELESSRWYMKRTGKCLFCRIIEKEIEDRSRIICENEGFICFLPFFAHWPYGVHVYSKRHIQSLPEFSEDERETFAEILKKILTKFDNLFGFSFPYIMVFHQKPTDGKAYPYYHFHVEFYPPYRDKEKLKFFAGVELGTGTTTYDHRLEDKAEQLRQAKVG